MPRTAAAALAAALLAAAPVARAAVSSAAPGGVAVGDVGLAGGSPELRFVDEDGDENQVTGEPTGIRWCSGPLRAPGPGVAPSAGAPSTPGRKCRLVRDLLVERSEFGFKVIFAEPWSRTAWAASIKQPAGVKPQRVLVERLVQVARDSRVRVSAECLQEPDDDDNATYRVSSLDPPLEVWAPLIQSGKEQPPLGAGLVHFSVPGAWTGANATGACVAIVSRRGACTAAAFSGPCKSRAMWAASDPERFLRFELPRPPFSVATTRPTGPGGPDGAGGHVLCFHGRGPLVTTQDGRPGVVVLGQLKYFPSPVVHFMRNILRVGVRTFLNPGWQQTLELECANCTQRSRIVVQPILPDARCRDMAQQSLVAVAAAARDGQVPASVDLTHQRHSKVEEIILSRGADSSMTGVTCQPLERGPCSQAPSASGVEDIDVEATGELLSMVGRPLPEGASVSGFGSDATTTKFLLQSARRLLAKERQVFFHHRSALCFYPTPSTREGWLVGFAVVQMDGPDMQAFIGFVCFFGVALPLICLVSALLHYNKYEQCKQHVQQLRLEFQRDQLDREMALRRTGAGASAGAGVGWLPHWHRLLPGAYVNNGGASVRGVGTV